MNEQQSTTDPFFPLWERIKNRDARALVALRDALDPLMVNIALRVLHNVPDAEDATSAVFLSLWERPNAFDPKKGKLLGWLIRVCRFKAIDALRSSETRSKALLKYSEHAVRTSTHEHEDERPHDLEPFLSKLPENQACALRMVSLGHTDRAASVLLGVPLGTYKTRRELGAKKLRRMLRERQWTNI